MSNLVCTISSIEYFHYLETWIKSFHLNEKCKEEIKFHVTIILKNDNEELEIFNTFYKKMNVKEIIFTKENYDIHYVDIRKLPEIKKSKDQFIVYCAHYKLKLFVKFKDMYDKIMWIDCDGIIKKTLIDLFKLCNDIDLLVKFRPKINTPEADIMKTSKEKSAKKYGHILAGVIVVNNKELILELDNIYKSLTHNWFNDQKVFDKIIDDNKYKIGDIPMTYFSLQCDKNHHIWLCKGKSFPNNRDVWQNEVKVINNNIDMDKKHLGGHINKTNLEIGTIDYLINKYKLKSFLDIGCGTGGMVEYVNNKKLLSHGVEGDGNAINQSNVSNLIKKVDFSIDKYDVVQNYDLGYSVEFLEHVDEKFIDNYIDAFKSCKYILITAAPEGWPGHHHVNCKSHEYWLSIFNKNGFYQYPYETLMCRDKSTMNIKRGNNKTFIKHRCLFFINSNLVDINTYNIIHKCKDNNIIENNLIISKNYKELHLMKNDTNKVTHTNGFLFKSTIPLISFIK